MATHIRAASPTTARSRRASSARRSPAPMPRRSRPTRSPRRAPRRSPIPKASGWRTRWERSNCAPAGRSRPNDAPRRQPLPHRHVAGFAGFLVAAEGADDIFPFDPGDDGGGVAAMEQRLAHHQRRHDQQHAEDTGGLRVHRLPRSAARGRRFADRQEITGRSLSRGEHRGQFAARFKGFLTMLDRRRAAPRLARHAPASAAGSGETGMKRSSERFLTTHTGSLPRPEDLIRTMFAKEEGVPVDRAALDHASGRRSPRSSPSRALAASTSSMTAR